LTMSLLVKISKYVDLYKILHKEFHGFKKIH